MSKNVETAGLSYVAVKSVKREKTSNIDWYEAKTMLLNVSVGIMIGMMVCMGLVVSV